MESWPMNPARSLTAVIWDYDGTLVDTRAKNWGITRAIVERFTGIDPDSIEALSSLEAYTQALYRNDHWRQLYIGEFGMSEEFTVQAGLLWSEYQLADQSPAKVYDGIETCLRELGGTPQGIVSMNSRANILGTLEESGLLGYFRAVIGFEEVDEARQKPAPDGLLRCVDELTGMAPGQVVYVGDHQVDIECVRNANAVLAEEGRDITVFAIGAAYGIGAEFGAWPVAPDFTIAAPLELLDIVRG